MLLKPSSVVDFHGRDGLSETRPTCVPIVSISFSKEKSLLLPSILIRSWLTVKDSEVLHPAVDNSSRRSDVPDLSRHDSLGPP